MYMLKIVVFRIYFCFYPIFIILHFATASPTMYFKPLSEEDRKKIAIYRDEKIFKAFFISNFRVLENYAILFVKDKHIAEDIVSEVMWKMWHLGSDLVHVASVESYLSRAVKNKSLNYLRIKQASYVGHEELTDYPCTDEVLSPERLLISDERIKQIEEAIEQLPSKTQQAFKLVKDESRSYKAAAEIMGISTKTVDRHIQIALQKLWNTLKKKK